MKSRYYQAIPILRKLVVIKQGRNNPKIEKFLDEFVTLLLPIIIQRNDGEILPTIYNADEYIRQNLPIVLNEIINEEQIDTFIKELMILLRTTVMDLLPSNQYNFDAELDKLAPCTHKDLLLDENLCEPKQYITNQNADNEEFNHKVLEIKLLSRKSIIRIRFFLYHLLKNIRQRLRQKDYLELVRTINDSWELYKRIKANHSLSIRDKNGDKLALPRLATALLVNEIEAYTARFYQLTKQSEIYFNAIADLEIEKIVNEWKVENVVFRGILDDLVEMSLEQRLIHLQPLFQQSHGIESQDKYLHRISRGRDLKSPHSKEYRQYLRNEFNKIGILQNR